MNKVLLFMRKKKLALCVSVFFVFAVLIIANISIFASNDSPAQSTPPPEVSLDAPGDVKAIFSEEYVKITWRKVDGAKAYTIYKKSVFNEKKFDETIKLSEDDLSEDEENAETYTYLDYSINSGFSYTYSVAAASGNVTGSKSSEVSVDVRIIPQKLQAKASEDEISLTWYYPDPSYYGSYEDDIVLFTVERSMARDSGYIAIEDGIKECSYNDIGVALEKTYYYRVVAIHDNGVKDTSEPVSVTTQKQQRRAILRIILTSSDIKEYDLPISKVKDFIEWFKDYSWGYNGDIYEFKVASPNGPFTSRKDYIVHRKIRRFEVNEYAP